MALTTRRLLFAAGLLGLGSMVAAAQEKPAETRTLKARIKYTGAGTVDEKHRIFLFVFDGPNFAQGGSIPIGFGSTTAKDGTVTVSGLSVSPVYVAVAFDASGKYDGVSGPPPSGTPMGFYANATGAPEPVKIEPGKTAEITVAFDDSFKMP
jgi:hypothetical protein